MVYSIQNCLKYVLDTISFFEMTIFIKKNGDPLKILGIFRNKI